MKFKEKVEAGSYDKKEVIEGYIPKLSESVNVKGQMLRDPKEEKRGNISSIDSSVNINGANLNF